MKNFNIKNLRPQLVRGVAVVVIAAGLAVLYRYNADFRAYQDARIAWRRSTTHLVMAGGMFLVVGIAVAVMTVKERLRRK